MEIIYNLENVDKVAQELINNLKTKTLLLIGDMGVGKTTLIKALIKKLGSQDEANSPTFSIVNEYDLGDDRAYHFDLYRINDIEEAYNFGIEDYLDSDNWVLIEWPEIIEPLLENNYNVIQIELYKDNTRKLVLK
ncbi:tRNA (adenosine(37)-N6)-threonylcarbamoyltransferase complex ATPase subunit type 1 TsaE [Gaetbulibacter saemankumensis]|uniref:tRNA (adenosine(37)-N6)-threonylcarbamoyltransferase complex ATPase subunit type 1 TsaE n=1 Tax=Gaetbulibacter saemankumensis TaxID=311208 RepID=UPI000422E99F|nr:tRNA (adenosine(37)-N6)-threonylcarbamoyltransferase complex ATPase subunit type 1 TsaE [Gaetbulibacter saemankumensis]